MGNEYMRYPRTVKLLAAEIKLAVDDYFAGKINNDQIEEIVSWYASYQSDKLFVGDQLNTTITKIIGKQRSQLLKSFLQMKNGGR